MKIHSLSELKRNKEKRGKMLRGVKKEEQK